MIILAYLDDLPNEELFLDLAGKIFEICRRCMRCSNIARSQSNVMESSSSLRLRLPHGHGAIWVKPRNPNDLTNLPIEI